MPELPEVESVRIGLAAALTEKIFAKPEQLHPRALNPHSLAPLPAIAGHQVTRVRRRGKFLWVETASELALVAHLGMSGQFRVQPNRSAREVHLRVRLPLQKSSSELRFIDQRTFGWLAVDQLVDGVPTLVSHIAPDIFEEAFVDSDWIDAVLSRRLEIKKILLDQSLMSGVGNIYADESLWLAKIHPETRGLDLDKRKLRRLLSAVRKVMGAALEAGGTSFDALYVNVNGESGYFERSLEVYSRDGEACSRCGAQIMKVAFSNRHSHFCPNCQMKPQGS